MNEIVFLIEICDYDESLNKIKSDFIVDETKYDSENIPEQIRKLTKFSRVGTKGKVFIESKDMTPDTKLKIILVSRFLANKLDNKISPSVTILELSEYSGIDKDQVRARMSNIVEKKFANRDGKGVFIVLPFRIKNFIDEISIS